MLVGIVLFGLFFIFLLLEFPIAVCLGLSSLITLFIFQLIPLSSVPFLAQQMFAAMDSYNLLAIPLFIITGTLLSRSGISQRLVNLAKTLVGNLPGGLALVAVLVSIFFAGISGSGPADTAALGLILIPAMISQGYPRDFSAALMAAGGGLGIIIPPSIALIIYGVLADTSISQLFLAGIIPGLLLACSLAIYIYYRFSKEKRIQRIPVSPGNIRLAFKQAFWGLLAPVIILGGIYSGLFTPTEAAAVAVVYALMVDLMIYRELSWKEIRLLFNQSGRTSATILFIIASASLFSWILYSQGIAGGISQFMIHMIHNKFLILFFLNLMILAAGCFMDAISIYYIFVPIFLPLLAHFQIHPLHFGIIMTLNLAIGQITPPVGVNLFVASSVAKVEMKQISRAVIPLILVELLILALITYFPILSLALPNLLELQ